MKFMLDLCKYLSKILLFLVKHIHFGLLIKFQFIRKNILIDY